MCSSKHLDRTRSGPGSEQIRRVNSIIDNYMYLGKASGKHVHVIYTPLYPTFICETGVYRGIPIFLIFASKHRLWVLVRTASARRV